MARPSRKRAAARCGITFESEPDGPAVDELLAEAQQRARSDRARELIREARALQQSEYAQQAAAESDEKVVVWHCEGCDDRFEERDDARVCCGGDVDDPEEAAGVVYDHYDGVTGVKTEP